MEPDIFYPDFSLEGRKALVTGGSRGIGRALALGLAHAGAAVAVTGRKEETLSAVAQEIETIGKTAIIRRIDVTDLESIRSGIQESARLLRGLDILVNNAGYEQVCDSLEVSVETWDAIVNTNLRGAFFCAQAAARIMSGSGGGDIVNVCSLTSSIGIPTAVPYTSSKSGLLGMTRALAAEWGHSGIRVNAIAPGYVHTAMTDIFFQNESWAKGIKARIPLGRFGQVHDLIGATIFLCSDAANYVTGQMITIDGGFLASI